MREQFGVRQKSADGIVLDPTRHSDEEGLNELRKYAPVWSRYVRSVLPHLSLTVNRQRRPTGKLAWMEFRIEAPFNTRLEPPSALKRMLGGVGAGGRKAPGYPIWAASPLVPALRQRCFQLRRLGQVNDVVRQGIVPL